MAHGIGQWLLRWVRRTTDGWELSSDNTTVSYQLSPIVQGATLFEEEPTVKFTAIAQSGTSCRFCFAKRPTVGGYGRHPYDKGSGDESLIPRAIASREAVATGVPLLFRESVWYNSNMRVATRVRGVRKQSPVAIACISVTYQGSSPFDVLDTRIRAAMDVAKVERLDNGTFRASTPSLSPLYTEGTTRRAALSELWEEARWLLADPVKIAFEAGGRMLTAEVLAERRGGYSVSVPELPGCFTCGDTMDEVRKNIVEAAELCLESSASVRA